MTEEKLIETLVSLGFSERKLLDEVIKAGESRNAFVRVNDGVLATFLFYPRGETRPTHTHPELRLTLVRSGKGILEYNGKGFGLEPGVISVISAGVPHSLHVLNENDLNLCEIVIDNS